MPAIWTEEELYRYSRHLLLPEVGVSGQEKIQNIEALVTATCLGGWVEAAYLIGAGVAKVTVPSNAVWSKESVQALNPGVSVQKGDAGLDATGGAMFYCAGAGRAWQTLCDTLELSSCSLEELIPTDPFGRR